MAEQVELNVVIDSFAPTDERPDVPPLDKKVESDPLWNGLDDEQRAAVLFMVRDGLLNLVERVQEWVPQSFQAKSGHRLDVNIIFDLIDVDSYVMGRQLEGERELQHMRETLTRMTERFGD